MLCHEGELRSPQLSQSRLQVLMLGEAPVLGRDPNISQKKTNSSIVKSENCGMIYVLRILLVAFFLVAKIGISFQARCLRTEEKAP